MGNEQSGEQHLSTVGAAETAAAAGGSPCAAGHDSSIWQPDLPIAGRLDSWAAFVHAVQHANLVALKCPCASTGRHFVFQILSDLPVRLPPHSRILNLVFCRSICVVFRRHVAVFFSCPFLSLCPFSVNFLHAE